MYVFQKPNWVREIWGPNNNRAAGGRAGGRARDEIASTISAMLAPL